MNKDKTETKPVNETKPTPPTVDPPKTYNIQVMGFFPATVTAKSRDYAEGVAEGAIRTKHPEFTVLKTVSDISK